MELLQTNRIQNNTTKHTSKIEMFVLALLPILNIYKSPIPIFTFGSLLVVLLMVVHLIRYNSLGNIFIFPPLYKWFWIWCAISYALTTMSIGAIIPGGMSFFIFTIIMLYMVYVFNMNTFIICYRIVFVICSVFFFIQFFSILRTGTFTPALLQSMELADGTDMSLLVFDQKILGRACSLFREPAHFAQYILPLLAIELFYTPKKNQLITPFAVYIILVLLLLRSGNGLVGLALLLLLKIYQIVKSSNLRTKLIGLFIALPFLLYTVNYYVGTTIGEEMLGRSTELENDESAHSWGRVWRGYYIYESLPIVNKVIGASDKQVLAYMPSYMRSLGNERSDLYVNGIQQVLIGKGIIGLILFLSMLFIWSKRGDILSKALLLNLIGLFFVAQLFLSDAMLLSFIIIINNLIHQNKYV